MKRNVIFNRELLIVLIGFLALSICSVEKAFAIAATISVNWNPTPIKTANALIPSITAINSCEVLSRAHKVNKSKDATEVASAVIAALSRMGTRDSDKPIASYINEAMIPCLRKPIPDRHVPFYEDPSNPTGAATKSGYSSALCARNEKILRATLAEITVGRTREISTDLFAAVQKVSDRSGAITDPGVANQARLAIGSQCEFSNKALDYVKAKLNSIKASTTLPSSSKVKGYLDYLSALHNCRPTEGKLFSETYLATLTATTRKSIDTSRMAFVDFLKGFVNSEIDMGSITLRTAVMQALASLTNPLLRGTSSKALDLYIVLLSQPTSLRDIDPREVIPVMDHFRRVFVPMFSEPNHSLKMKLRYAMALTCARKAGDPALAPYCVQSSSNFPTSSYPAPT